MPAIIQHPRPESVATGMPSVPFVITVSLDSATTQQSEARRLAIITSPDEITEAEIVDVEESLAEIRGDKAIEFKNVSEALKWLKE